MQPSSKILLLAILFIVSGCEHLGKFNLPYLLHPSSNKDNNQILLSKADQLRIKGECISALPLYNQIISSNEKLVLDAKEGKALCYIQQAEFSAALDLFKQITIVDALRWKVMNGMGIIFAISGNYKEAIEYFELASTIHDSYLVLNNLALARALNNQYQESILALKQADNKIHNPQHKQLIQLNLALIYGISGQLLEAENIAQNYLSTKELYQNMSFYAELAQNQELAKEYLAKAFTAEN